jgi:ribose/xylose/arabinose/galactoside ABC-type transport system permease subunit
MPGPVEEGARVAQPHPADSNTDRDHDDARRREDPRMSALIETERPSPTIAKWRHFLVGKVAWMPVLAAVVILVIMLVAGQAYFGRFVTPRILSSLFVDNAYLIVLAAGMTFVILTGGIDLSVGAVMAFTGMLAAKLMSTGVPAPVVIPIMLIAGATFGLIIGVMVHYFDVQPFIASLAGMFLARGLCFVVSLEAIQVKNPLVLGLQSVKINMGDWYVTPTVIIALLLVVVATWVLGYTRFGRTVYAVGGNEQSARLMGLHVARTKVLVYVVSGVCAGIAGLLFTAYTAGGVRKAPSPLARYRASSHSGVIPRCRIMSDSNSSRNAWTTTHPPRRVMGRSWRSHPSVRAINTRRNRGQNTPQVFPGCFRRGASLRQPIPSPHGERHGRQPWAQGCGEPDRHSHPTIASM